MRGNSGAISTIRKDRWSLVQNCHPWLLSIFLSCPHGITVKSFCRYGEREEGGGGGGRMMGRERQCERERQRERERQCERERQSERERETE